MHPRNILPVLAIALMGGNSYAQEAPSLPQNAPNKTSPPAIKAIQPSPVPGAHKRQWIKIIGSDFTPKSQVTLYLRDRTFPIPAERTKFVSDKELDLYVNVSMGPSTWTVQVANQGGKSSQPFSFNVKPPAMLAPEAQTLKEQGRKIEIEALEKKAQETDEKIEQIQAAAEAAKLEAAEAAAAKVAIQPAIEEKEQAVIAAKQQLEAARAKAQALGNLTTQEEVERRTQKVKRLERALTAEQKKLAAIEAKEQQAQEEAAAAKPEIERLRKEFAELRELRATKRTLFEKAMTSAGIFFAGLFIWLLKTLAVKKFESVTAKREEVREGSARLGTLVALLNWLGTILIVLTGSYLILDEFGINMAPVLASVGIVGLALGFGGQYLIRDIINGIFILVEGQYNINDVIEIGAYSGVVECVNLRHTKLRDLEGRAIYIPNGEIKTVANFTQNYGQAVLDIGVAYKENVDRVIEVIQEVAEQMRQLPEFKRLIKDFEMFGVESFGESGITIRCRFKTTKMKQWGIAREYRRRIKNRFDELGIEIPLPHRIVHWSPSRQENNAMELETAKRAASVRSTFPQDIQ